MLKQIIVSWDELNKIACVVDEAVFRFKEM